MTHSYLKMMWTRIDFLRIVLEKGYNFGISIVYQKTFQNGDVVVIIRYVSFLCFCHSSICFVFCRNL
ncbi:unnamed protein product [Arabidopsis halleri]